MTMTDPTQHEEQNVAIEQEQQPVGLTEEETEELAVLDLQLEVHGSEAGAEVIERIAALRRKRDGDPEDDGEAGGVIGAAIRAALEQDDEGDGEGDEPLAIGTEDVPEEAIATGLTEEEATELAALEAAFEANGGRGVEDAERIDELRAKQEGHATAEDADTAQAKAYLQQQMRQEYSDDGGDPDAVDRWVDATGADLTEYDDLAAAFEDFDLWVEVNEEEPEPVAPPKSQAEIAVDELVASVEIADDEDGEQPIDVQEMSLVYLDPADLLAHRRNVRENLNVDEGLVDSIRNQGVIEPLTVVPFPDGKGHLIVAGHRRAEAARQAGVTKVPCVVRTDMTVDETDNEGQAEHIATMLSENLLREGLTTMEEVKGVGLLLELGVPIHKVAKKTGLGRKRVAKAAGVAAKLSEEQRKQVDLAGLTLDQAAVVALFSDDEHSVQALLQAAGNGPGSFAHEVNRQKQDRARREQAAAAIARLEADGRTVVDRVEWDGPHNRKVSSLVDDENKNLDVEEHRSCPGSAVAVVSEYNVSVVEVCMNPAQYGHKERRGYDGHVIKPAASDMSEEERAAASAERKAVIDNNKAMLAANATRREWVALVLKRRTVPYSVWRFCLDTLEQDPRAVSNWLSGNLSDPDSAMPVLGIQAPSTWRAVQGEPTLTNGKQVGDQTLAVKFLAHVAGAIETGIDRTSWRRVDAKLARWLKFCVEHGYTLSEVEQLIVDQVDKQEQATKAAAAEREAERVKAEAEGTVVGEGEASWHGLYGVEEDDVDWLDGLLADHVRDGGKAEDVVAWVAAGKNRDPELAGLDDSEVRTLLAEWVEAQPVEVAGEQEALGYDEAASAAAQDLVDELVEAEDVQAEPYAGEDAEGEGDVDDDGGRTNVEVDGVVVASTKHLDLTGEDPAEDEPVGEPAEDDPSQEAEGVDVAALTKERSTLQKRLDRTKDEAKRAATSARIAEIDGLIAA